MGAEYVWLDVLCLRQHSNTNQQIRDEEWKLDVPTIGNIYRTAAALVRYFNGLGQPFRPNGWDNKRHWLCRAWTLQEIRSENTTINGAITNETSAHLVMDSRSEVDGIKTTLRKALHPIVKLAAQADSPRGCSVYDLVRQMAKRHATQPTDKVAGLLYLLHTTQLPTYDKTVSDEDAWTRCFHVLPFERKLEILCDYPYRGCNAEVKTSLSPRPQRSKTADTGDRWFPTWRQLMQWPDRDPTYDHAPAAWPEDQGYPQIELVNQTNGRSTGYKLGEGVQSRRHELKGDDQLVGSESFFVSNIWAISRVQFTHASENTRYEVRVGGKTFGFYCPYVGQKPIDIQNVFTLAIPYPDQTYNWVVCESLESRQEMCKSADGKTKIVRLEVLRKVGVLRTDSCSELYLGAGKQDSVLKKIHALFT